MTNIIYLLKTLLFIFLLVFTIEEWIKTSKGECYKCWLGLLLQISIFTSPAHLFSLISESIFLIAWLFLTINWNNSKLNKINSFVISHKKTATFVYYCLPVILYVTAYSIPLVALYGVASLLVILQIIEVILLSIIICLILYMAMHLKYLAIWMFKLAKRHKETMSEIYEKHPISIYPYIFIIYLPIIMM